VPFTPAHGAAVLPFRRFGLVPSALLIGSFAPDFEYFVRLAPTGRFGHTVFGAFVLTLPLALLVLWLFHNVVKVPLSGLLPDRIRRKLANDLNEFHFRPAANFARIVCSVLLGIATHLVWDSFTHPNSWPYHHWPVLRQALHLPIIGSVACYKVLQHGSTIIGLGVLSVWVIWWYRTSESSASVRDPVSPNLKMAIGVTMAMIALVGATIRAMVGTGVPKDYLAAKSFFAQLVVTAIALVWWQLVAYGVFTSRDADSTDEA
jgi:Domain of unknown function (DUF4184)